MKKPGDMFPGYFAECCTKVLSMPIDGFVLSLGENGLVVIKKDINLEVDAKTLMNAASLWLAFGFRWDVVMRPVSGLDDLSGLVRNAGPDTERSAGLRYVTVMKRDKNIVLPLGMPALAPLFVPEPLDGDILLQ